MTNQLLDEQTAALVKRMHRVDVVNFFELLGKIRPSLESYQRHTYNPIYAEILGLINLQKATEV